MTFRGHMLNAIASLEAALLTAEQERDKAVFQVASGVRSQLQLGRMCERVALVRSLWRHAKELLPQNPSPQGEPTPAQAPRGAASRRAS
jgi:hypothetical protein